MNATNSYSDRFHDSEKVAKYAARFECGKRLKTNLREQRAVRKIFSHLPDCRSVLDVPSGTGRFLANLAQENRDVIEMDVAVEMVDYAKGRAEKLGIKAQFMPGDAGKIPLPDASVEGIFCNRLLHHFPSSADRLKFLREFHRVSRRYLVISFFDYRAMGGLRVFLKRLKGRKVNYAGHATLREFVAEVTEAGFRVVQIVSTGPFWISEKYFVLQKTGT